MHTRYPHAAVAGPIDDHRPARNPSSLSGRPNPPTVSAQVVNCPSTTAAALRPQVRAVGQGYAREAAREGHLNQINDLDSLDPRTDTF